MLRTLNPETNFGSINLKFYRDPDASDKRLNQTDWNLGNGCYYLHPTQLRTISTNKIFDLNTAYEATDRHTLNL